MTDSPRTMEYFFARLFAANPEIRSIFPLAMAETRAAVFDGMARLIWLLDKPPEFDDSLRRIARMHRKFGVRRKHYQLFVDTLVATVEHVSGGHWTPDAARAWSALTGHMTAVLEQAAADDQRSHPPWWIAEIVRHDRRSPTVAVLTVRPDQELSYGAGQFITVQVPRWPRIWRYYSIANAPRDSGLLDLHVRAVPGGMVSNALVSQASEGDIVILGAPDGDMRPPADAGRDIVCIGSGTGLAPLKAIIEAQAGLGRRHGRLTLCLGARDEQDFYDLPDLLRLQSACSGLTIVPAVRAPGHDPDAGAALIRAVRAHASMDTAEVYLSGPAGLIEEMAALLTGQLAAGTLHYDPVRKLNRASRGRLLAEGEPYRR